MKKRILVVDDEQDLVEELALRLEASGLEVQTAYDGPEGLEQAKRDAPDLILLDIVMPTLDGYHVCRALKEDPRTQSIPVIMLSVKVTDENKAWGKECGADEYIIKPYEAEFLLGKIRGLLQETV